MKWYGVIGYGETVETKPGVWTEEITERTYYGEVSRNTRMLQSANQVNDNINISIKKHTNIEEIYPPHSHNSYKLFL